MLNDDSSCNHKNNEPVGFVDDLLIADIEPYVLGAIVGCLEAVFVILGFPMPVLRQIMVTMDKLKDMIFPTAKIASAPLLTPYP